MKFTNSWRLDRAKGLRQLKNDFILTMVHDIPIIDHRASNDSQTVRDMREVQRADMREVQRVVATV
jgi:hypothetical protein